MSENLACVVSAGQEKARLFNDTRCRADCHTLPLYLPCPQLVDVLFLPPGRSRRESELTSQGWLLGPQWRVQPECPVLQSLWTPEITPDLWKIAFAQ